MGSKNRNSDEQLALALAAGRSADEAAAAAGVSPSTVDRRLREQPFRQRIAALRAAMIDRACGRLAERTAVAADVLGRLSLSVDDATSLRAAVKVLELALKVQEMAVLLPRLEAVEAGLVELQ